MKREVIIKATGVAIDPGSSIDPNSSPYPWHGGAPGISLMDVFNAAPPGVGGGINEGNYVYGWPGNAMQAACTFEKGPTLVRFTKITILTGFDYSQTGPNNWWFPPDNAHGPGMQIILRKRNGTDWIGGTSHIIAGESEINAHNSRPANPGFHLYTLSWELTAHPEGGPFLLEDINNLAIGVTFLASEGPNGMPYTPEQGGFFKIRCPYLKVTLEIEDLGGYVANVRHTASLALRMMRRARNAIIPKTLIHQNPAQVGTRIYMSHPRGPSVIDGEGWGIRRLERRAGLVVKRTYYPESFQVEAEAFDLRHYSCLGWASYRIETPWNPELQGVALLDKGLGFTHTRAQDAWSPRPGDSVLHRILEAYPNVSFHGLAVQGGGDTSVCTRNYDCQQSGWSTVSNSGDFSAAADSSVTMAEEQGYLGSCKLTYGAGGAAGGRERSLGALGSGRLHVRVIIKNSSIPTPATQFGEWYLRRGTTYWNATTRTWIASPQYNAIPNDTAYGEAISDSITASADTYHIGVGRFSSQMGPVTLHAGLIDVQWSDTTVAGARTPLVTLDSTIVREADLHEMSQVPSLVINRELWSYDRGVAVVEAQPFWIATDLPADAVKPLIHANHATNTWDALQFVPKTGSPDLIRFERAVSGESTFQLDCPLIDSGSSNIDLTREHVLRAWVRWLGSDGWSLYAPYSVEVGYGVFLKSTGALVHQASILGALSVTTPITARNYIRIGCDSTPRYFDGYIRMWETRLNPLHGIEAVWKV